MPSRKNAQRGAPPRAPRLDRKALQLCKQARRALDIALAGECEALARYQVTVRSVVPAPDALRLRVDLAVGPDTSDADLAEARVQLGFAQGFLRNMVAQEIHRHRVPELAFILDRAEPEAVSARRPRADDDE